MHIITLEVNIMYIKDYKDYKVVYLLRKQILNKTLIANVLMKVSVA